jgi:hypothetical protein
MTGLERLKQGDFNRMSQDKQPDSSVIVRLWKRGTPTIRFLVRNLYQDNEEMIWEEVIER